jgi:ribonucleoside-triphosphate reductase
MKDVLNKIYPEVAKQYEEDLNHHIIYTHDEASTPVLKQYCMAVSLFPLLTEGVGNIDGVTPGPPNDLQSFSGQITNLAFLLSSQCKGAVAFGEYFIALNYYVRMEFGND